MKLRHPWIVNPLTCIGTHGLALWMSTIRCRKEARGQPTDPWAPGVTERFIYAFWHESMLSVHGILSHGPLTALASQHADGEIIAQICQGFGISTVRGSSTRGGSRALQQMIGLAHQTSFIVTPDGPRGPRRRVKRGLIHLASWTGMRIVPVGVGFQRAWRTKSWDCFALPKPFSRMHVFAGPVLTVPRRINKSQAEDYRQLLERAMLDATVIAEAEAVARKRPVSRPTLRWTGVAAGASAPL